MKAVESILTYYEHLQDSGVRLTNKDIQHYAQCQRILAVAAGKTLKDWLYQRETGLSDEELLSATDSFEPYELFED